MGDYAWHWKRVRDLENEIEETEKKISNLRVWDRYVPDYEIRYLEELKRIKKQAEYDLVQAWEKLVIGKPKEPETRTYVRSKPLPPYGTPERMKIEREIAHNMSFDMLEDRIEQWIQHEIELKKQRIMYTTKHPTLRRFLFGLGDFWGGMTEDASDVRARKRNRRISVYDELKNSEIEIYTRTPDELPERERKIAKRIISKYI